MGNSLNKGEKLLEKIKHYAEVEHLDSGSEQYDKADPRLIKASLELARDSKSVLGGLYYDFRKSDSGLLRQIKNKIIGKVSNIVRNTLERPLLTQQKYNEQSYYLIETLLEQNKSLTQRVEKLEQEKS